MKRPIPKKLKRGNIDPEFRRLSRANSLSRMWQLSPKNAPSSKQDEAAVPPESVPFHILSAYLSANRRSLDPEVIEQESRAALEKLCEFKGKKAIVDIPPHKARKNVKGFVVYPLEICGRALELISKSPAKQRTELKVSTQKAVQTSQDILRDLEGLREAQDAPDFIRRPTDEAYKAAHKSLETAYTHHVGSAPPPALAPDGDGGVVVQWKLGKREVRLVVPPEGEEKSYVFSRGDKTAKIDYDIAGLVLAQQLRSTFTD